MRGILLSSLIKEQAPAPAAPVAPPTPPQVQPQAPAAQATAPADTLVQKDFNAFKNELKQMEQQKSNVISKWEGVIKKKVSGQKVKVLASKAQHFQPASEYTIDVSDVKIGWHYDKTAGEIVYDLILVDGDKKYFMKSKTTPASPPEGQPSEPTEPETAQSPQTPEAPPEKPEEPAAEPATSEPELPSPGGPEAPVQPPAPENPGSEVPPSPEQPKPNPEPEVPEVPPKKKKPVVPVPETSILNAESYSVEEIIRDVRPALEELTGRENLKPFLVGAGRKNKNGVIFELNIPKSSLRRGMISSDIILAFKDLGIRAKVNENYRGNVYTVQLIKEYDPQVSYSEPSKCSRCGEEYSDDETPNPHNLCPDCANAMAGDELDSRERDFQR